MALRDDFTVDTDLRRLDLNTVHKWLSTDAYWASGRSLQQVQQAADASLNFGLYSNDGELCAYARVVTDGTTFFAWLCDVYVAPGFRWRGLGQFLSASAVETLRPMGLKRVMLTTADAQSLYQPVRFIPFRIRRG